MPFKIVRNDITKMQVDVIVNTANVEPIYSSGTDLAVYKAAGEEELLAARRKIGFLNEGEVAITPGFKLPAKYIIHAVSPYYEDGKSGEEKRLRSCYRKSLLLATEYGCKSIAFPLIATGSFGYPKEEGIRVAVDEINGFLLKHDMLVYLVVFDTESTRLGLNLYPDLEAYIDHNYVCEKRQEEYGDRYFGSAGKSEPLNIEYSADRLMSERSLKAPVRNSFSMPCMAPKSKAMPQKDVAEESIKLKGFAAEDAVELNASYDDFVEENEQALKERMKHLSDTFQQYLFYLIKSKGLTNSEVYKRAIITKQLFSKIKLNPWYHPDKATAMRLCVGAGLNLDETKDLLARAGYALSPCDKRDIIFSFFIEKNIHDMIEIDIALEEYGLPCFIE